MKSKLNTDEISFVANGQPNQIAREPTKGKWFKVEPLAIDKNLFKKKRKNSTQEATRQLILEAFEEVEKNSKYTRPFRTMIPEKTWNRKNVGELKALASKLGEHNADWVEQALEWAQRIANGELWSDICNNQDMLKWYRLVIWKNGYARLVGGSRENYNNSSTCDIDKHDYCDSDVLDFTVPLVVTYE